MADNRLVAEQTLHEFIRHLDDGDIVVVVVVVVIRLADDPNVIAETEHTFCRKNMGTGKRQTRCPRFVRGTELVVRP